MTVWRLGHELLFLAWVRDSCCDMAVIFSSSPRIDWRVASSLRPLVSSSPACLFAASSFSKMIASLSLVFG